MKRPMLVSVLCVAAAMALLFWGTGQGAPSPSVASPSYALVIEDDTGTFLMQLAKGMREAAQEQGASLSVEAAEGFAYEGWDAVFLLVEDPAAWLAQYLGEAPVVVIGAAAEGRRCLLTDDAEAARQLVFRAAQAGGRVMLVTDDEDARSRLRTQAALPLVTSGDIIAYAGDMSLPPDCAAAVCVSARATQALASMRKEGGFAGLVLGVDTGERRVSDLEEGLVDVMALDNPYAMGYLAVSKAAGAAPGNTLIPVLLADRTNMYRPENVKQVFPLLQ